MTTNNIKALCFAAAVFSICITGYAIMTRLGAALTAYQQKHDVENRVMTREIGISASTLSRIKGGTLPDALGMAKIMLWLAGDATS